MNAEGLPKAFDHKLEPNTKLAKFKEVRSGKWSLRSVKSRRLEEAAEIAEFVAQNVSFQGNYKIWSPGAGAIGVGARACRMLGDESRRKRTFEPVRVAPPNIINEVMTNGAMQVYADAGGKLTGRLARVVARSHLGDLEDALSGRPGTDWMPIDTLEEQLSTTLAAIRHSLEPKKSKPR